MQVKTELRHLHQAAREIGRKNKSSLTHTLFLPLSRSLSLTPSLSLPPSAGEEVAVTVVDSAAVFLFTLFSLDQRWTREHAEKIRKNLGPFPASAANRACEAVKKILKFSPEKIDSTRDPSNDVASVDTELKKEFGHNIVFSAPVNLIEEVRTFNDKRRGCVEGKRQGGGEQGVCDGVQDSLSEDEASEGDAFSRTFLDSMAPKKKSSDSTPNGGATKIKLQSDGRCGDPAPNPYSSEWLIERLQGCCAGRGNRPWHDLYMDVFELLSSTQGSSLIQSDVRTPMYVL